MPYVVLPGGGDVVVIVLKILREKLGIDVMAQLKASDSSVEKLTSI